MEEDLESANGLLEANNLPTHVEPRAEGEDPTKDPVLDEVTNWMESHLLRVRDTMEKRRGDVENVTTASN